MSYATQCDMQVIRVAAELLKGAGVDLRRARYHPFGWFWCALPLGCTCKT
jgi:hypothetical protein